MSHLLYHENGHISPADFVRCTLPVATTFHVESPPTEAELFVLARSEHPDNKSLKIIINGRDLEIEAAASGDSAAWLRSRIEPALFPKGASTIVLPPQGWSIARPRSQQPVIRLRVEDNGVDDPQVQPLYGDPAITAQPQRWLSLLPKELQTGGETWDWCWQLAGFLASAWRYRNATEGVTYAPWDARTILQWGRRGVADDGRLPITMCVHYAVSFIQFCQACGVAARAVVFTPQLNSAYGHFVAEVWLEKWGRWAMIDPNFHLAYHDPSTSRPLSVAELWPRRDELGGLASFGEGYHNQRERSESFVQDFLFTGAAYRFWGIWGRHDWIDNPALAPPAHGTVPYAETDIIWCADRAEQREYLAMFPHFLSSVELNAAPT